MAPAVFISYARKVNRAAAEALYRELGPDLTFLDTSNIEAGENFPKAFTEALLDSRVVVVFASGAYFQSWYCLRELRTALAPYESDQSVRHIVIALPNGGGVPQLEKLPPALAMSNAPPWDDTAGLAALVRSRLEEIALPLRARLETSEAQRVLDGLVEEAAIPPPANLAGVRVYHRQGAFGLSLGRRFVGRANDLWRIHFELSTMRHDPAKSAAAAVRLHSGGGYGKSRVALEYVLRYGPRDFPGGLFWIEANTDAAGLEEQFYGILTTLRNDLPDLSALRKDGVSLAKLLRAQFSDRSGPPALVVVDDIPESPPGEKPRLLSQFCPALGLVSILATSRQSLHESGVIEIPLDALGNVPSTLLLKDSVEVPQELPDQDWNALSKLVDGLPLALDLLNRVIVMGAYPAPQLLQRMRTASLTETLDSACLALQGQVAGDSLRGISEALIVSFENLGLEAQYVACILAHFAPAAIPEQLMTSLGEAANAPAIRTLLISRHLTTGRTAGTFGVMHRVTADFLKTRHPDHQPEFLRAACRALGGVMTLERAQDPRHWPLLNLCRTHAGHLIEAALHQGAGEELVRSAVYIGSVSGSLLYFQGDLASAEAQQRRILDACRRLLGNEHSDTFREMNHLGLTLAQRGDLAAAHELQYAACMAQFRLLGPDHENTIGSLHNFGWTLTLEGNFSKAREVQEFVLRKWLESPGPEHPNTAAALSNLANTLSGQGDVAQARVLQEEVLRLSIQDSGEESISTLTAMCNLGKSLRVLQETNAALDLLTKAQEIANRRFGDEHPTTLLARTGLGAAAMQSGDLEAARRIQQNVLDIQLRKYGPQHPETITAMNNLGITLYESGAYREAKELQEAVVQARTQAPGPSQRAILAMRELARTLSALSEFGRSIELMQQAYQAGKRLLGLAHPDSLLCGAELMIALGQAGDSKRAETLDRELSLLGKLMHVVSAAPAKTSAPFMPGEDLEALILRAREQRDTGESAAAFDTAATAVRTSLYSAETPLLATAIITLGTILLQAQRFEESFDCFETAASVSQDLGDTDAECTARMWMGKCAEDAGHPERAISAFESAYQVAKAGQLWPDVNAILSRLAPLYGRVGRPNQQWACEQELAIRVWQARRASTVE